MKAISSSAKALSFAFEQIFDALPDPAKVFFLRAEPLGGALKSWQRDILNIQSHKPVYDQLCTDGCRLMPQLSVLPDDQCLAGFDLGLLLVTKHKQENLANLAHAWTALRPGGRLICVGGNDVGISSLEKSFKSVFNHPAALSKYHCKVLWGVRGDTPPATLSQWATGGQLHIVPSLNSWSQPGIYNWNKIDAGSALLVQHLPPDLQGRAADLGAGWGYLSQQLLLRCPAISTLDLFEAEALALHAAKANLPPRHSGPTIHYHWHDVTQGLPAASFDVVVMNPPFHEGKAVDMELGRAFITSAAQGLAPTGCLYMVANRQLPYEEILSSAFNTHSLLYENGVYKVLTAVR